MVIHATYVDEVPRHFLNGFSTVCLVEARFTKLCCPRQEIGAFISKGGGIVQPSDLSALGKDERGEGFSWCSAPAKGDCNRRIRPSFCDLVG